MPEQPFVLTLRDITRRRIRLDAAAPFLPEEEALLAGLDETVAEALRAHAPGAVVAVLDQSCLGARFKSWDELVVARRAEAVQPYLTMLARIWVAGQAQVQLRRYAQGGCAIIIEQTDAGLRMVASWYVPDPRASYDAWVGPSARTTLFYLPLAYGHEPGESGAGMSGARGSGPIAEPEAPAPPKRRRERTPRPKKPVEVVAEPSEAELPSETEIEVAPGVEEVVVAPPPPAEAPTTTTPPETMANLPPRRYELGRVVWQLLKDGPRPIGWGDVTPHMVITRGPFVNNMRGLVASGLILRSGEHPGYLYARGCPWVQPIAVDGRTPLGAPVNLNDPNAVE